MNELNEEELDMVAGGSWLSKLANKIKTSYFAKIIEDMMSD